MRSGRVLDWARCFFFLSLEMTRFSAYQRRTEPERGGSRWSIVVLPCWNAPRRPVNGGNGRTGRRMRLRVLGRAVPNAFAVNKSEEKYCAPMFRKIATRKIDDVGSDSTINALRDILCSVNAPERFSRGVSKYRNTSQWHIQCTNLPPKLVLLLWIITCDVTSTCHYAVEARCLGEKVSPYNKTNITFQVRWFHLRASVIVCY